MKIKKKKKTHKKSETNLRKIGGGVCTKSLLPELLIKPGYLKR